MGFYLVDKTNGESRGFSHELVKEVGERSLRLFRINVGGWKVFEGKVFQ